MALLTIYIDNHNVVELNGFKDAATGLFQNAASVTAILYDSDGVTVVATADMTYASGSDGIYRGTFPHSISIVEGVRYLTDVTAVSSQGNLIGRWKPYTKAIERR